MKNKMVEDMGADFGAQMDALVRHSVAWVRRHPKRLLLACTAFLSVAAGATFAVANLAPDPASLPLVQVADRVQPVGEVLRLDTVGEQALRLYRSDVTRSSDTAEVLLKRLGVVDPHAAAFLRSDTLSRQTLLGHAGRAVTLEADASSKLKKLTARWSPEDDGNFKRLTIENIGSNYQAKLETIPMGVSMRMASGTISSSLFAATDEASVPDAVAIQLAEIFSGDIDFHRALRKGDHFTVVYEMLEGDGEPLRAGRVMNAEFTNAGKTYQAVWFQEPIAGNPTAASHNLTKGGYYNLAGESLRRSYLSSPLEFSRVTSGFEMRFHPILKIWRAHLGTDYAASTGTPVRCVGDGVVEFAGVQNGFGNVVIVKHANQHETVYAHLSAISVRQGQTIAQGQNLGAVGATGWATGPHLHFEFRINGIHHDPLTVVKQSETIPIAPAYRAAFAQASAVARAQFEAAASVQVSSIE